MNRKKDWRIKRVLSNKPICGIYQLRNKINNKIYIGQSIDIERRWTYYKYNNATIFLKNAIKKYSIENFEFRILEKIDINDKTENQLRELLYEREQYWFDIEKPYKYENGYNINKTAKPNYTEKRDEEFGKKISRIKIENNHCGKPIIQYDLEGKFIKEWRSAAQIERELGYYSENISAVCLKKNYTSHRFIWRFKTEPLKKEEINNIPQVIINPTIRQYDLNGKLVATHKNSTEASLKTGISAKSAILHACSGRYKTSNGFIWKYGNKELNLDEHKRQDLRKPVLQFDLNGNFINEWESIIEASKKLNICHSGIRRSCNENYKTSGGFIWKYC